MFATATARLAWVGKAAVLAMLLGALAVSLPRELPAAVQLGLVVGLGSTSALLWELMEYETFIKGGTELDTAYTDTLGDMTLGTIGATLAGLLVLWLRRRRSLTSGSGGALTP